MNAVASVSEVGARKVDLSQGSVHTSVSRQWWNRPDDERYLSVQELRDAVAARRDQSLEQAVNLGALKFTAAHDTITVNAGGDELQFTNWSATQLCQRIGVPASFLPTLPPVIQALVMQARAMASSSGAKLLVNGGDLRAVTSDSYGRIWDVEVADQLVRIADAGGWKVPGKLNWQTMVYDPNAPVTIDSTSLFASDRDVFAFLCQDTQPIEVGKTKDGDPDLMFRGFIARNSETGNSRCVISTMLLRAVCENRMLWGVEDFQEVSLVHTSGAPGRFEQEAKRLFEGAMPQLDTLAKSDPSKIVDGVKAAKAARLTSETDTEEQIAFLTNRLNFSKQLAMEVIGCAIDGEGAPPSSAWGYAQAITRRAHDERLQDERVAMERVAGKLLDKVTA